MVKKAKSFFCTECGHSVMQWLGKCPGCDQWNTFVDDGQFQTNIKNSGEQASRAQKASEISLVEEKRVLTQISEFDRVVGGGLVAGSLILIGGEPGIGKSTLLTSVMGKLSQESLVLYISGEESNSQIAKRVQRLNIKSDNLLILNETNWDLIKKHINLIKPKFIVLDSIQTTMNPEIQSAAGSPSQVKDITFELMTMAKQKSITAFVIGHITKDGAIAGPKLLEHMVDAVIYFEGDQHGQYRLLRAIKNRFGNTNEIGIFEMNESGLVEVINPSKYFIDENNSESFGRSLSCIVEGSRTLFVEVQALVVENKFGNGRRTTQGLDTNRLAMLVAVVDKYMELPISYNDIYLNIVGGVKLQSRETDLAVIASLISSYKKIKVPNDVVFLGEVGLTGEIRSPVMFEVRLKEISQLKYKKIITSKKMAKKFQDITKVELIGMENIRELQTYL